MSEMPTQIETVQSIEIPSFETIWSKIEDQETKLLACIAATQKTIDFTEIHKILAELGFSKINIGNRTFYASWVLRENDLFKLRWGNGASSFQVNPEYKDLLKEKYKELFNEVTNIKS